MSRVLVLAAMPLELRPLLAAGGFAPSDGVTVADRTFFTGRLGGTGVVVAMTGIGLVNARQTAEAAFDHFGDELAAATFCGVAGSTAAIGDVVVPDRWTIEDGASWYHADRELLATADALAADGGPVLARAMLLGDAAGLVPGADASTEVRLLHQPAIRVGGIGLSDDPFGGEPLAPSADGGDVFGGDPWAPPGDPAMAAMAVAGGAFEGVDAAVAHEAKDMETAAVAEVAAARDVAFLGIRGVSDGPGDPLDLPGFPSQFFAYRQLAADNAAAVTVALLAAWPL